MMPKRRKPGLVPPSGQEQVTLRLPRTILDRLTALQARFSTPINKARRSFVLREAVARGIEILESEK